MNPFRDTALNVIPTHLVILFSVHLITPTHSHSHSLQESDRLWHQHRTSYFYFTSQRWAPSDSSAGVHPEYQKAEEHSDSHERDGRRGGEELPVIDAEVPNHGQNHHEHGHHQAARADGHAGGPEPSGHAGPSSCSDPGLSPFLWTGLVQGLGDVAVNHAVVCNVK